MKIIHTIKIIINHKLTMKTAATGHAFPAISLTCNTKGMCDSWGCSDTFIIAPIISKSASLYGIMVIDSALSLSLSSTS